MRRLLVFGTGAAVIGIMLLIVAFYEAYLIVSTLQAQVGNSITNTNVLLEDATLEAVFLGVMAALGYGLVAKGLDGLRRQELLEMEEFAGESFGRGQFPARMEQQREVVRPATKGGGASAAQGEGTDSHPGIKRTVDKSVRLAPVAYPKAGATVEDNEPEETAWEPTRDQVPPKPSPATAITSTQAAPIRAPTTRVATSGFAGPKPGEVVWEGEAPPPLVGVEVMPEPTTHGATAAFTPPSSAQAEPEVQQPWVSGNLIPPTPKRGRGRPKGSKSTKKPVEPQGEASTEAPTESPPEAPPEATTEASTGGSAETRADTPAQSPPETTPDSSTQPAPETQSNTTS